MPELTNPTFHFKIPHILEEEANVDLIVSGRQPKGYDNFIGVDEYQLMGWDNGTIYGNSRSSFATVAYLQTNLALQSPMANIGNIDMPLKQRSKSAMHWVDNAAVVHIGVLPKQLQWVDLEKEDPAFKQFSFRYQNKEYNASGSDRLSFVHSGYAFGGDRENSVQGGRYSDGKLFGPHDCSSWTASITNSSAYSTIHLLAVYRKQLKQDLAAVSEEMWASVECQDINKLYEAIPLKSIASNPKDLVKPGMLFAWRSFKEQNQKSDSLGNTGHVVLVLGVSSQGNLLTLGYNREMPKIEGFGIREFSLKEEVTEEKMLFTVKK